MNQYARRVIDEFTSRENLSDIKSKISGYFNNTKVNRFLNEYFIVNVKHFVQVIEQELNVSDLMPGLTIYDQLVGFNNQFIASRINFIQTHVIGDDHVPMYSVSDGMPTSRSSLHKHQQRPNDILNSWLTNSGRGIQSRDDPSGLNNNLYQNGGISTGIAFCDQDHLGTQNHVEFYENTSYKQALNKRIPSLEHEETAFGVDTPAANARLLSRRIFRQNEAGVENGIARYESRLYNRHLERDIDEGLHNAEKGCMLQRNDMSSLYARVDHKNKFRPYEPQQKSQLYNNNSHVHAGDRYQ